jgi:hypothetical protein
MTLPSLIEAWRPHREERKPAACDHRAGCWVLDPYHALDRSRGGTPRCSACGGKIPFYGGGETTWQQPSGQQAAQNRTSPGS